MIAVTGHHLSESFCNKFICHTWLTCCPALLQADQLKPLETELGLSASTMAAMLVVANIAVTAVYLVSVAFVSVLVWPAVWNLLSSFKFVVRITKALSKLLKDPRYRPVVHLVLYTACFHILAAGTIVQASSPAAGLRLALLAHVLVYMLAHIDTIALR